MPDILERKCHDCGSGIGELHRPGCDMEVCPFCYRQLIMCGCCYRLLGVDVSKGSRAYSEGLSVEQEAAWERCLTEQGFIPYVPIPIACVSCGNTLPKMFGADDWHLVVPEDLRGEVLCWTCYSKAKAGQAVARGVFCRLCGSAEIIVRPADWLDVVPPGFRRYNLQDADLCSTHFARLREAMLEGWRKAKRPSAKGC
mgnify:CR=1 FL=1